MEVAVFAKAVAFFVAAAASVFQSMKDFFIVVVVTEAVGYFKLHKSATAGSKAPFEGIVVLSNGNDDIPPLLPVEVAAFAETVAFFVAVATSTFQSMTKVKAAEYFIFHKLTMAG